MANLAVFETVNEPSVQYVEHFYESTTVRPDNYTAVRKVELNAEDEVAFIASMLGYSQIDSGDGIDLGKDVMVRFPPEPHPDKPWLFSSDYEFVEFLGPPGRVANQNGEPYTPTHVNGLIGTRIAANVTYTWPADGLLYLPDSKRGEHTGEMWRYVSRKVKYDVSGIPLPKQAVVYKSDNKPIPAPGSIILATSTLYYTWWQIPLNYDATNSPQLPPTLDTNINALSGLCNSVKFDNRYPPQTILFTQADQTIKVMPDGNPCYNLTYIFGRRGTIDLSAADAANQLTSTPHWNRALRGTGKYDQIILKAAPNGPLYNTDDLNKLFAVA